MPKIIKMKPLPSVSKKYHRSFVFMTWWFILLMLQQIQPGLANWWYLGMAGIGLHDRTNQNLNPTDLLPPSHTLKELNSPTFALTADRSEMPIESDAFKPLSIVQKPNSFDFSAQQRAFVFHQTPDFLTSDRSDWTEYPIESQPNMQTYRQTAQKLCKQLPGLVNQQLKICEHSPSLMYAVSQGARIGISECQQQFQNERWNCTAEGDQLVFGRTLMRGSRETAFVHAITSAGVAFAVTQSCSAGRLTDCGCDRSYVGSDRNRPDPILLKAAGEQVDVLSSGVRRIQWRWGGCSDNVKFGITFAKRFVDAPEVVSGRRSIRAVMNLHNNKAGREAIKQQMQLKCRCHGVSGSCELKTCWRTLPEFELVGKYLKSKYEQSVPISGLVGRRSANLRRRRRGRKMPLMSSLISSESQGRPSKEDLVHISKSLNYCNADPNNGILGTSGRRCERHSNGPDSCDLLCCGRGYHSQLVRRLEECHCKFQWCCHVTCRTCEKLVEIHTCK